MLARLCLAVGALLAAALLRAAPGSAAASMRYVVYGGDENFPPYEFLDAQGQPAGLNIDLMRAIARERGFTVDFRLAAWPQVREALKSGRVDVAAMYRSAARAQDVDFAIPHELVYHEMYIRKGSPPLRTLDDLPGKRILVQQETFSHNALVELGYGERLVTVASEPEALQALARGDGDVAIVTQTVGRPFTSRAELGSAIAATGAPVLLSEYAFVTRKGRRSLVNLLNDGVIAVKASGEHEQIYGRWIHPLPASVRWIRWLLWSLGGAASLLVWFVLWNAILRRRVLRQTQALRHEFEERERSQAVLAESERQLRQAQKLETVGRLAGGIAHDFNNILTIILNYASFLRTDLVEARLPTADVDEILAASERASRLTRQLLVFSRDTPVETARLDLTALLRETLGMIQRLVGEDILIETVLPNEPVVAEIDRTGIEQALFNLAANARDAMKHQGRLVISIGHSALQAGNALRLPAGDYAAITVTDTGSGMNEHTLAHVGEPFFTTKEVGKGTGLGLASVFATLAKHGGTVVVRSELGRGSTFELVLPRVHGTAIAPAGPKSAPVRRGAGETVLLVEDDEALRRAAHLTLTRHGYRVLEAGDGESALQLVLDGARFDLLVTDVIMPRRSGPLLAAELRHRIERLLVLYVSGYVHTRMDLELGEPGTAFLTKPYTGDELAEAVRALLAGEVIDRSAPRVIR